MNTVYANIVSLIHIFIGIIMYFGILLPEKYLIWYILVVSLIHYHWQFNDGYCILTTIEYKLRDIPICAYYDSPFIKYIIKRIEDKFDTKLEIDVKYIDDYTRFIHKGFIIIAIIRVIRWIILNSNQTNN